LSAGPALKLAAAARLITAVMTMMMMLEEREGERG